MSTSNGIVTVQWQNKFQMHNRRRQRQGGGSASLKGRELAFNPIGGTRISPLRTSLIPHLRYGDNRMQDYEAPVRKVSQEPLCQFAQTGGSASLAVFSDTKTST